MTSLNKFEVYQKLQSSGLVVFSKHDIQKICNITNDNTTYKLLQRLEHTNIIERITSGSYQLKNAQTHDFTIANILYKPSYISLESALARYSIIAQFPFVITSITTARSKTVGKSKTYEYIHMAPHLYYGFIKEQDYLIATPEKALFDALYLMSKGLRMFHLDEMDLSVTRTKTFREYCKQTHIGQFQRVLTAKHIL